jgi:hypothetical protein
MNKVPDNVHEKLRNLKSTDQMLEILNKYGHSEVDYLPGHIIVAQNKMDHDYQYTLKTTIGDRPDLDGLTDTQIKNLFLPHFTPAEMLEYGVFEGHYLNDCILEFPKEWFLGAIKNGKLNPAVADVECNHFGIKSRMPLKHWKDKGWIYGPDNRGWFQWYCRYYLGRRIPEIDEIQIKRWKAFRRHLGQVKKNCDTIECRPKQRQALLQWSHNAFITSDED